VADVSDHLFEAAHDVTSARGAEGPSGRLLSSFSRHKGYGRSLLRDFED
jgi:hypothetical protein